MNQSNQSLRIAVAQMTSVDDIDSNCQQMLNLIGDVPDLSLVDLVTFPENALYFRLDKNKPLPGLESDAACFKRLAEAASHHQVTLLIGSAPMLESSGRTSNATVMIRPNGSIEVAYRKIHLFDVDVVGQPPVRESDLFTHGEETRVIEVEGWRIGLSICYDLRFAELYTRYARQNVDAIFVPSAFLVPTGQAHWHVLLRARAIESQAYVIAPAQGGEHVSGQASRKTFGHSLVVDPWGDVILEVTQKTPEIKVVTLERQRLDWVRSQIPQSSHRRL